MWLVLFVNSFPCKTLVYMKPQIMVAHIRIPYCPYWLHQHYLIFIFAITFDIYIYLVYSFLCLCCDDIITSFTLFFVVINFLFYFNCSLPVHVHSRLRRISWIMWLPVCYFLLGLLKRFCTLTLLGHYSVFFFFKFILGGRLIFDNTNG